MWTVERGGLRWREAGGGEGGGGGGGGGGRRWDEARVHSSWPWAQDVASLHLPRPALHLWLLQGQPINQSINQSINQLIHSSIKLSTN